MTIEEKAKELQREYKRKWRKKNPERVKNYNANYWLKKAKNLENNKREGISDEQQPI